jgi:hypothetical protein
MMHAVMAAHPALLLDYALIYDISVHTDPPCVNLCPVL